MLGKKQNGEGADHFRANFGPIFRNVTRLQLQSWLSEKKTDVNDATTQFFCHTQKAHSPRACLPSPGVWLDKCSKSQFPLSDGIRKGSTAGQWFFGGKWVTSSPWRFGVQTRKHKLLLQNLHRCIVLDPLLDTALVSFLLKELGGKNKKCTWSQNIDWIEYRNVITELSVKANSITSLFCFNPCHVSNC